MRTYRKRAEGQALTEFVITAGTLGVIVTIVSVAVANKSKYAAAFQKTESALRDTLPILEVKR